MARARIIFDFYERLACRVLRARLADDAGPGSAQGGSPRRPPARATIGKVKRIETKLNTHLTGQSGAYCIFGFISGQFLWVLRSQTQQPQVGPVRFAAALRRGRPAASPSRPRAPTREAECRDCFGNGVALSRGPEARQPTRGHICCCFFEGASSLAGCSGRCAPLGAWLSGRLARGPGTAGDRTQEPAGDRPRDRRAAFTRWRATV